MPIPSLFAGASCVILLHEVSAGDTHFDWLIDSRPPSEGDSADDDPDRADLVCFRCPARPDHMAAGETLAIERIADHRRRYLRFEGEIGRGLGRVGRVAQGKIVAVQPEGPAALALLIEWSAADAPFTRLAWWFRLQGQQESRMWTLSCIERSSSAGAGTSPAVRCAD